MKIAVMLCGLPRSYKKTFESFRKTFSEYDCDVYIHSWRLTKNSVNNDSHSKLLDPVIAEEKELSELFFAKKVKVEEQIKEEIPGLILDSKDKYPNNAVCFHESVKRCFRLIEDVKKYDLFIITRPDIFYYEKLTLEKLEKNTIMVPYINHLYEGKRILATERKKHPNSFFDMLYNGFVVGNYEDLKTFADFTDDYVPLCNDPKYFLSNKLEYSPDRALAIYIKLVKGIKVKEFRFKHGIFREKNIQLYSW